MDTDTQSARPGSAGPDSQGASQSAVASDLPAHSIADFSAALPEPVTIFGVRLLPLSLGRYRLLKRFDCSFVADGPAEADMPNLLLGVLICSMPCREFTEFIESSRARKEIKRWGKRIRKEIRHDAHFTIFQKFALFRAYLVNSARIPLYWEESDSMASSGAHWSTCIESTLRSDMNYSREEIEERPLSKAIEDYFKRAETLGAIRLMTAEEIAIIAAAAAAEVQSPKSEVQSPPETANRQSPIAEEVNCGA